MLRLGSGSTPVSATKVTGAHLTLTSIRVTTPSRLGIASRWPYKCSRSLGACVCARASSYKVISLSLKPQPFVRVLPMTYPASETYFFKPLNERVPVFQKPVTLLQELGI